MVNRNFLTGYRLNDLTFLLHRLYKYIMFSFAYKPILLSIILCLCFSIKQFAQNAYHIRVIERRNPAIGLHYGITNFSHSPFDISLINHGYALSFLDGISGKYDYMVQGGSISPQYPLGKKPNENKNLLHFIDIYGIRRCFADTVLINPFIAAGPGITLYNGNAGFAFNAGAGFQLRISSTVFLHTQINYQVHFSPAINNNVTASVGLLGTILKRNKRIKAVTVHSTLPVPPSVTDTDGDGIADSVDACPTLAGPATFNGCPDTDGDGIPDNRDKCPHEAGTVEYGGCPPPHPTPPAAVAKIDTLNADSITRAMNELGQLIYFETNKATLRPESTRALNTIVALLKAQPFKHLQIEGHTDNTGTVKRNEQLSEERAKTVLAYLVAAGIDALKLTAKGFGSTKPVADNNTPEGRAHNRRTAFVLYQ